MPTSTADATRYAPSALGPAVPRAAPSAGRSSFRDGRRSCAGQREPDRQREERAQRERHAPAQRQRQRGQGQAADQDRGRDPGLLDPEPEPLTVARDLLGHEQVDRRLGYRVGHAGHRQQPEQHDERGCQRHGGERCGRHEDAAPHRAQRADMVREPPAPAGAESAGKEEHGHAGGHGLHARVEVRADLKCERSDEEARQHARRTRGDRER
jgi:hypothetical protein